MTSFSYCATNDQLHHGRALAILIGYYKVVRSSSLGDQVRLSLKVGSWSSSRRAGPSMAILDGQIVVATILRGPSMMIAESQFEAIVASLGHSMAIFDGQIVVVESLRGPSMDLYENQFRVIVVPFRT